MATIPKGTEFSSKFSKEFGLVFRDKGDFEDERTLSTPEPTTLENNLDNFLTRWKKILQDNNLTKTLSEIENLRARVRKGCLSGLKPGEGTECNESLHNTLISLVHSVTTDDPELVIAILTLFFYGINSKRKGKKHSGNTKVIPFIPILNTGSSSQVVN